MFSMGSLAALLMVAAGVALLAALSLAVLPLIVMSLAVRLLSRAPPGPSAGPADCRGGWQSNDPVGLARILGRGEEE